MVIGNHITSSLETLHLPRNKLSDWSLDFRFFVITSIVLLNPKELLVKGGQYLGIDMQ